ncbi:hypothetical protein [Bradyrhizobium prioriisuperbiae]|uniref:hypothetical protein n=1 Tax=Bradyrhizobium prioriisuperbiae TaxID=2854389 RepID=UPI0028ED7281|nr:hypothetical protein [Bradyrhizobium prioritasuperba]
MVTNTQGSSARQNSTQQVHYLRFAVNYNDSGIANGIGKQWLPKGAIITGTSVYVGTAFNAATTNVLTVGTNSTAYDNIVGTADVDESAAVPLTNGIKPSGAALGPLAADAQVFVKYAQTGTAATAGAAVVVVHYVPNNDL